MIAFNLDEQIFFKNEKTNKVYTLTLNRNEKPSSYDVTREWTVPDQAQLSSKTDRFPMFRQAAELTEHLYKERIEHGYIEVMRRQGVRKQSSKINQHKGTETKKTYAPDPVQENMTVTGQQVGKRIEQNIQSRHRTTVSDRMNFGPKR